MQRRTGVESIRQVLLLSSFIILQCVESFLKTFKWPESVFDSHPWLTVTCKVKQAICRFKLGSIAKICCLLCLMRGGTTTKRHRRWSINIII